jgi:hypothetical protein
MAYVLICAVVGLTRGRRGSSVVVAGVLAAAMACAQLALMLIR